MHIYYSYIILEEKNKRLRHCSPKIALESFVYLHSYILYSLLYTNICDIKMVAGLGQVGKLN
jgi:hypothetical protein